MFQRSHKLKYKFSQDELYFEIDTEKDLGGKIESDSARELIANDLIQSIIDRANNGKGVDKSGNEVKLKSPYSKGYANSLAFDVYGKEKNDVNLQLTGSMMDSINVLESNPGKIRIGIVNEDAPKAFNHQTGDTVPKRPFLGATKDDLEKIKKDYKEEISSESRSNITVGDILDEQGFGKLFEEFLRRGII
jgi:phage gpG-like protein